MSSLEKMEEQRIYIPESDAAEVEADLVIVGGGPAGLTAGIYAARGGLKAVIVEKGILGGQIATTPVVENYPGITQVGGKALVDIMVEHALQYSKIFPAEEVLEVQPGDPILVATNRRRFKTRAVLLATGARYRNLGAPGVARLSGHGVSYCSTCDGPLFSGKKVIIVGGGGQRRHRSPEPSEYQRGCNSRPSPGFVEGPGPSAQEPRGQANARPFQHEGAKSNE